RRIVQATAELLLQGAMSIVFSRGCVLLFPAILLVLLPRSLQARLMVFHLEHVGSLHIEEPFALRRHQVARSLQSSVDAGLGVEVRISVDAVRIAQARERGKSGSLQTCSVRRPKSRSIRRVKDRGVGRNEAANVRHADHRCASLGAKRSLAKGKDTQANPK